MKNHSNTLLTKFIKIWGLITKYIRKISVEKMSENNDV